MNMAVKNLSKIHLLGQFDHPFRGAELALLDLADLLVPHREVCLWSVASPHPSLHNHRGKPIRQLSPYNGIFPKGDTLVIGGIHFDLGPWLAHGRYERILLIYNIPNNQRLLSQIEAIRQATGKMPELIYVSLMQKLSVGLPGVVHPVPMNLDAFWAMQRPLRDAQNGLSPQIVVGRISRDSLSKHDPQDAALYRSLSARGCRVRIVGGMCLKPALDGDANIELLPEGALSACELLQGLDLFFYRTGAAAETFGRVIWEAMASGLPVVAQAHGGYSAWLQDRQHALLVHTQEQAFDALMALAHNAALRQTLGESAQSLTRSMYSAEAVSQWLLHYLQPR